MPWLEPLSVVVEWERSSRSGYWSEGVRGRTTDIGLFSPGRLCPAPSARVRFDLKGLADCGAIVRACPPPSAPVVVRLDHRAGEGQPRAKPGQDRGILRGSSGLLRDSATRQHSAVSQVRGQARYERAGGRIHSLAWPQGSATQSLLSPSISGQVRRNSPAGQLLVRPQRPIRRYPGLRCPGS